MGDREKLDPITGVNPPFHQTSPPEERHMGETDKAMATRARLLNYHRNNGSMGGFYELYQDERPNAAVRGIAENIHKQIEREKAPQQQLTRDRGEELER